MLDKYTYKISYHFYNGDEYEDVSYLYNRALGKVPDDPQAAPGFSFSGWYSKDFENENITENSYVIQIYTKEHETPIILCYDNEEERNDDFRQIAMNWEAVKA